jgi:hypothetical protein
MSIACTIRLLGKDEHEHACSNESTVDTSFDQLQITKNASFFVHLGICTTYRRGKKHSAINYHLIWNMFFLGCKFLYIYACFFFGLEIALSLLKKALLEWNDLNLLCLKKDGQENHGKIGANMTYN